MARRKRRRRRGTPGPRRARAFEPFVPPRDRPRRGPLTRFSDWSSSPRVAGWLFTLMTVFCAVGAVSTYYDALRLRDYGVRTVATVVSVHDGRDDWVRVRFTTRDGREVTTDVTSYRWDPRPRVGDRPEVVYDPEDPDIVADVRIGPDFFFAWLLAAMGLVFAALASMSFRGQIDWRRWSR